MSDVVILQSALRHIKSFPPGAVVYIEKRCFMSVGVADLHDLFKLIDTNSFERRAIALSTGSYFDSRGAVTVAQSTSISKRQRKLLDLLTGM